MTQIIGIINANGGLFGELGAVFRQSLTSRGCTLRKISHSGFRKKAAWNAFVERARTELGVDVVLLYKNQRDEAQLAASAGREPCVLIADETEHISMIVDWNDLKLAKGNVATFERILKSKLLMY